MKIMFSVENVHVDLTACQKILRRGFMINDLGFVYERKYLTLNSLCFNLPRGKCDSSVIQGSGDFILLQVGMNVNSLHFTLFAYPLVNFKFYSNFVWHARSFLYRKKTSNNFPNSDVYTSSYNFRINVKNFVLTLLTLLYVQWCFIPLYFQYFFIILTYEKGLDFLYLLTDWNVLWTNFPFLLTLFIESIKSVQYCLVYAYL